MSKTRSTKYRINWLSNVTGVSGHGEPVFEIYTYAKHVADTLTQDSHGLLSHWVELCEVLEDEPQEEAQP